MSVRDVPAMAILAFALSPGFHLQATETAEIEAVIQKDFKAGGPGGVVEVIHDGKVIHRKAYGFSDLEHHTAMTPEAVFDLASCSKQFTALAVMLLAEKGKLSLDDDVRKFLPELPEYNPDRPIRIVDLLHMVSGLASYMALDDVDSVMSNEDVVKLVARAPLQFPTGTKHLYSNTDYSLLALIVKRASGMSLGAFLKSAVFDPLGMKHTVVLEREKQTIPHRIHGYKMEGGRWVPDRGDTPTLVGDGNVFSCVDDLAVYDRALRDGKLVSAKMLQRAYTPGALDSGEHHSYGFGWEIVESEGEKAVWHNGAWSGTSTCFSRHLGKGFTVIVLLNIGEGGASDLSDKIEDLFLKDGAGE